MLFSITGGPGLSLFEVEEAAGIIKETADPEANIIFGTVIDERMGEDVSITVIATGFDSSRKIHRSAATGDGGRVRACQPRLHPRPARASVPPPCPSWPRRP